MLERLIYVRVPVSALGLATEFATEIVGLGLVEESKKFARFRADEKTYTLEYDISGQTREPVIGFEVRGPKELEEITTRLTSMDIEVEEFSDEYSASLRVKTGIGFVDFSGNRFEVCVRHEIKGTRFFGARDAGVQSLSNVALRSANIDKDTEIWTDVFAANVRDYVGQSVFIGFNERHHAISLHPSAKGGLLQISFEVEDFDDIMRSYYLLSEKQVQILHGPGKLACSGEMFVTFEGPDKLAYRYSCEMDRVKPEHRPRQFVEAPASYCEWGSQSLISEFSGGAL